MCRFSNYDAFLNQNSKLRIRFKYSPTYEQFDGLFIPKCNTINDFGCVWTLVPIKPVNKSEHNTNKYCVASISINVNMETKCRAWKSLKS